MAIEAGWPSVKTASAEPDALMALASVQWIGLTICHCVRIRMGRQRRAPRRGLRGVTAGYERSQVPHPKFAIDIKSLEV